MSDYVKGEINRGSYVGMVLIDLQKAFDTVDHVILLDKLRSIRISSVAWLSRILIGPETIGGSE